MSIISMGNHGAVGSISECRHPSCSSFFWLYVVNGVSQGNLICILPIMIHISSIELYHEYYIDSPEAFIEKQVIIMPTLSPLLAFEVVITTTSGANSEDNVGIMITFKSSVLGSRFHDISWDLVAPLGWCHDMKMLSALLALCEGNPLVTSGFLSQRGQQCYALFFVSLNML